MALDLLRDKGTPLSRQSFTWRELVQPPHSKLDDDAMTRVRIILMNGIESEANRFGHAAARFNADLQPVLAQVRRVEQHQQTMVNWLLPADLDPLETTLAFEQVAIEVTAAVARREPDAYQAQVYRFGLLEDFDHLYRFSALYDRLYGKDPNNVLQSYTDILPGRPTSIEHRSPLDDLRTSYDRLRAAPITKLHAATITAAENQTHDYYMTIGPMFADPTARMLYAEIASIEEQHVTQYESLADASETWLEKWVLHEANEVYLYWSCVEAETNPRIKAIWERMLSYELGHLRVAVDAFQRADGRDVTEILPQRLPEPLPFESNRAWIRKVLAKEETLRTVGAEFVDRDELPDDSPSLAYAARMNKDGSPSELVAAGYRYRPGTELVIPEEPRIAHEKRTGRARTERRPS